MPLQEAGTGGDLRKQRAFSTYHAQPLPSYLDENALTLFGAVFGVFDAPDARGEYRMSNKERRNRKGWKSTDPVLARSVGIGGGGTRVALRWRALFLALFFKLLQLSFGLLDSLLSFAQAARCLAA